MADWLWSLLAGLLLGGALVMVWNTARAAPPPVDSLHQAAAALGPLLDTLDDLAWVKDADGRFVYVNACFGRVFQRVPASLIGRTDYDLSPPAQAAHYREDDQRVMRSGRVSRVEETVARAGGSAAWAETVKVPLFDASGKVVGTAGIARTRDAAPIAAPAQGRL